MKKLAVFGAGRYGRMAVLDIINGGGIVSCIVDNDKTKQGKTLLDIPVISLEAFSQMQNDYHLILAVNVAAEKQIKTQFKENGIADYEVYNLKIINQKERVISYSEMRDMEDVILYHVLRDEKEIFYIDVGSADPFEYSVTKLLYDVKGARGINIEPQKGLFERTEVERPRDINLCVGVGKEGSELEFFYQRGRSTVIKDNVENNDCYSEKIRIVPLSDICKEYIQDKQNISFLKIDVEGAEKDVLTGCDFEKYRPWIIVIESTKPGTDIECHEDWEYLLISKKYHFVMMEGVNRYYVSDEKAELDSRFCSISELKKRYNIYHATLLN